MTALHRVEEPQGSSLVKRQGPPGPGLVITGLQCVGGRNYLEKVEQVVVYLHPQKNLCYLKNGFAPPKTISVTPTSAYSFPEQSQRHNKDIISNRREITGAAGKPQKRKEKRSQSLLPSLHCSCCRERWHREFPLAWLQVPLERQLRFKPSGRLPALLSTPHLGDGVWVRSENM